MTTGTARRALALVGMPGSGKTLCAQHLKERGFFEFRFGAIVVNEVVRQGMPINPENERVVREALRRDEGMDVMARRALPHLQTAFERHDCIVIDGLYSYSEYKTLMRELNAELVVIAIVAPRRARYERLARRPDRPLTWAEAEARDFQEIETLEKGGPIALADYTLVNDRDARGLLDLLDTLVETLGCAP